MARDTKPGLLALVIQAWWRLFADEAVPLAGNIAFRLLFSVFPFLIFLTTLAGFFGNEELANRAVYWLLSVAPPEIVNPIAPEIHSILTVPRTDLLSLSVLLTIWSAMAGVDSLRSGLNRAYDVKETRHFAILYLIGVLFIIGAAIVMLALAFLLVLAPIFLNFVRSHAPGLSDVFDLIETLRLPLSLLLLLAGLTVSHTLLPARRPPFRELWPGVLITVLIWCVLATTYSWWLSDFATIATTYGSLSGLFAAMFFLYLSAMVFIFGGEVNRVIAIHREQQTRRTQGEPGSPGPENSVDSAEARRDRRTVRRSSGARRDR